MEKKMTVVMVVLVAVLMAEAGRAKGVTLCNMNDNGLEACKPSVTKPNPADPTAACCQALKGADLTCLCSYRNSPFLSALGIDPDLALALPTKCNIPLPADCH